MTTKDSSKHVYIWFCLEASSYYYLLRSHECLCDTKQSIDKKTNKLCVKMSVGMNELNEFKPDFIE